uniref:Uncharacterized protein LOC100369317 n=1 Tax=Saccoglossus kowalevskii TaxID=10224 RepID=A0ABM0M741_SACKO|nr:PREDICTED: uncharacterized protein LOC100369317 [Saccoglossus kowalevskii]
MGRRSWWLEEDGPKIYVYVNEGKKKDRLTDRKTGVPYPHVENVEVYPKKTDAVKFFFHSDSGSSITCPYVLERTYFEWNKSQYSKKFKETSNVREFVSLFSEMLSTNTERNTAPGNSSDSCSDVEDMSLSSDSASCSESSDKSFEKAVRKAKRRISDSTKDVSVVSLKRQKYNTDIEECKQDTQSTVQHAFCGHFLISVRALQGGQQIRVPDKVFLDKLVKSMEKYKDESYQPLCLLVKDVSSAEQFDGAKRNGYQYDVIGGQHTLLAIQELARKFPQDEKLKTVNCVVYAGLNNEERKWLGVRHNKTGEFRHALSLKEKVMICYGRRKEMPKDTKTTLWKESCKVILNEDKNSQTLDVACALASYDGLLYNKIMELFEKYEDGDLKEQRIKKKDQGHKPDIKPYKFKYLKSLDADTVLALVSDVHLKKRAKF